MIVDFTVSNFRSIKEPVTLSMLATSDKTLEHNSFSPPNENKFKLLKSAAIYGPNASGKSNLINAFYVFQKILEITSNLKLDEKIPLYNPYKLDPKYENAPTMMEMEFISIDNIRYKYKISYNDTEIINEKLSFFPKRQEALLFERNKNSNIKFGDAFQGPAKTIENLLLKNNLFLSKAVNNNNQFLKNIYRYLTNSIKFTDQQHDDPFDYFTTQILSKDDQPESKNAIKKLIQFADPSIQDIKIEKKEIPDNSFYFPKGMPEVVKKRIIESQQYKVITYHLDSSNTKMVGFDKDQFESDGTNTLYNLAGKLIWALINGYSFIIDEFDNSLHPHITEHLINIFNDPVTNPENAQLIFATHDTSLLNPSRLRRDQIWFTEKNSDESTHLFSLAEFKSGPVRNTTPFESWYLTGRFGAVPNLDRSTNWIKNAQKQTVKQTD